MPTWNEWLDNLMAGATVWQALRAVGACAATWLVLHALMRWGAAGRQRRQSNLATYAPLAELVLSAIRPGLFPIVALAVGLMQLPLGPWQARLNNLVFAATLTLQGLLIANRVIEFALSRLHPGDGSAKKNERTKSNLIALAKVSAWAVALLFFLDNFGINVSTFIAGLGIGGIAVALAAQAVLGDTFGSFTISLDKPFDVGDFIAKEDLMGTVLDVGLKTTRIRSLSGELWVVPNSELTKSSLRNYSDMRERRVVFQLALTYDTAAEAIAQLTTDLRGMIEASADTRFDRAHFARFGDSSLDVEVVWFVTSGDYNLYMDRQHEIFLRVLRYCRERDIDFAFPTQSLNFDAKTLDTLSVRSNSPSPMRLASVAQTGKSPSAAPPPA